MSNNYAISMQEIKDLEEKLTAFQGDQGTFHQNVNGHLHNLQEKQTKVEQMTQGHKTDVQYLY